MELPLLGAWDCAIDSKRRLTLPAKLRESLTSVEPSPELIVTVGHRGCLLLIPPKTWKDLTPDLFRAIVGGDEGAQRLRATMALYGSTPRIDNSGRVTLTEKQVKVANLDKDAVVLGNFTRIEVWNPERFASEIPDLEDTSEHDRLLARYLPATPKERS
ncbi:MAG: hypothetical protein V1774_01110 [Candidatus Eisenbacteria bacterium]